MRYKYELLTVPASQLTEVLNERGRSGWHVVHVEHDDNVWHVLLERKEDINDF